jgi:hypothetical protein
MFDLRLNGRRGKPRGRLGSAPRNDLATVNRNEVIEHRNTSVGPIVALELGIECSEENIWDGDGVGQTLGKSVAGVFLENAFQPIR